MKIIKAIPFFLLICLMISFAHSNEPSKPLSDFSRTNGGEHLNQEGFKKLLNEIGESSTRTGPNLFEITGIVEKVGQDPVALFDWVKKNTSWVPYHGALRGASGVLLDRMGNSLDRALLLAELLKAAGFNVRLASGMLNDGDCDRLLNLLKKDFDTLSKEAFDYFRKLEQEKSPVKEMTEEDPSAGFRMKQNIEKCFSQMTEILKSNQVALPASQEKTFPTLKDHWWVQVEINGEWKDLDPLTRESEPFKVSCSPQKIVSCEELDPGLTHQVKLEIVAERFENGQYREEPLLSQTLESASQNGKRIFVEFSATKMADESELKSADQTLPEGMKEILRVKEWTPILRVGSEEYSGASFDDKGLVQEGDHSPGAGGVGALMSLDPGTEENKGAVQSSSVLTAIWIDYTLLVPGQKPRKIRQPYLDLAGPFMRKSGKFRLNSSDQGDRLQRVLGIPGSVELFLMNSDIPLVYVLQKFSKAILDNASELETLFTGAREEKQAATKTFLESLTQIPCAPMALSLGRRLLSPVNGSWFIDHPNLFSVITKLKLKDTKEMVCEQVFDIIENGIGVNPFGEKDWFKIRFLQGITDTLTESSCLPEGDFHESPGELFSSFDPQKDHWLFFQKKGEAVSSKLEIAGDVRMRMEQDLEAGCLLAVLSKNIPGSNLRKTAWWRMNPLTGETLGVMDSGYHEDLSETKISDTLISQTLIRSGPKGVPGIMDAYSWGLRLMASWIGKVIAGLDTAAYLLCRDGGYAFRSSEFYRFLTLLKIAIMEINFNRIGIGGMLQ